MGNLNTASWKDFRIGDLFDVINNPQLDKDSFVFSDNALYPYFTRTENNNGILGYVEYLDDEHKIRGNSLAVGMISMKFHYMSHDFYAGQFTKTLIPKFKDFNETLALYFISVLNKYSSYYQSYLVREFVSKVNDTVCNLPVKEDGMPNWEYMVERIKELEVERIKELEVERIKELEAYLLATGLDNYELTEDDKQVLAKKPQWKEFRLGDLFNIHASAKRFNANEVLFGGIYPYVARGTSNNGIRGYITEDVKYLNPAKTFSFGQDTATVYYQNRAYFTGDKIKIMELKDCNLTERIAEFLILAIRKAFSNFAWGQNSFSENILNDVMILLPVVEKGTPNWDYMERYVRVIEKIVIADTVKWKDKVIEKTKAVVA